MTKESALFDLVLTNARILTLDPRRPTARSVAMIGARIVAFDEAAQLFPARRTVDCSGAIICPGLGDAHNHMLMYGLSLGELDVSKCSTATELLDLLSLEASQAPGGSWIVATGFDHTRTNGQVAISQLDRVSSIHPILIKHRSGHLSIVNSVVLRMEEERAGSVSAPQGGALVRDSVGALTGELQEAAQNIPSRLRGAPTVEDMVGAIGRASSVYSSEGLTHVVECGIGGGLTGFSPAEALAYQIARDEGLLSVRVDLMPSIDVLHPLGARVSGWPARGLDLGLRTGFGDDYLRLGPLKIWVDGSLANRTAAVCEPFEGDQGDVGQLTVDASVAQRQLIEAHNAGWRIAAHAIGDRAIDIALDALEEAQRVRPRADVRHRIEHASLARPDQVQRMRRAEITPVPQAGFLRELGDLLVENVGTARASWLYRHASFLDAGLRVPGSSDRPCVEGRPLLGMQSMVMRTSPSGQVIGPMERVDASTALRAYTVDEAWICRDEGHRGSLTEGALGDLTVLSDDPTQVPPERIADIEVRATIVGGAFSYNDLE